MITEVITEYILNILEKETNANMSNVIAFMKSSCRTNGIITITHDTDKMWIVIECRKGTIGEYAHIELWRNDPINSNYKFDKGSSVETIILPHDLTCHDTMVKKLYQFIGVISFLLYSAPFFAAYKARAIQTDGPAAHTTN